MNPKLYRFAVTVSILAVTFLASSLVVFSEAQAQSVASVQGQIIEGLKSARGVQAVVAEVFLEDGAFPDSNDVAGLPSAEALGSEFVDAIEVVNDGGIAIFYGRNANPSIHDKMVILAPYVSDGKVMFTCFSPDIQGEYLPPACR